MTAAEYEALQAPQPPSTSLTPLSTATSPRPPRSSLADTSTDVGIAPFSSPLAPRNDGDGASLGALLVKKLLRRYRLPPGTEVNWKALDPSAARSRREAKIIEQRLRRLRAMLKPRTARQLHAVEFRQHQYEAGIPFFPTALEDQEKPLLPMVGEFQSIIW